MVIYKLKLRCHSFSACLLLTLGRFLFNVFYICLALDSSNWIKICLDSSSRILELHSLMSFWLFCRWLWTSLCPVCQVCHMIIFCSFGIFVFLLRSTLFCFSFEYCRFSYLAIRSDYALSIWASPAKFKQFRPIYRFFKPEKLSQTQEITETFTKFCLEADFQTWFHFGCVFFLTNKNKQFIHI